MARINTPAAEVAVATPASNFMVLPFASLLLRVLAFVFLLVSTILIATNSATVSINLIQVEVAFNKIYSYRYMLSTSLIGLAYTVLQIPFAIHHVSVGKPSVGNNELLQFQFYSDKVIFVLLATGVGAGFGATVDLKKNLDNLMIWLATNGIADAYEVGSKLDKFFNMGKVSATFLLLAFICMGALSVISSLPLSRKG